ncbi:uncharacterized protein C11orf97 homolog isoform X2 [Cygnus atratus]|uniref:uncharacterized protein C11orf97 homolog isoform X2 n=1 Tax=Cygnus atratus TaxID=8868 RepID=UPI0021B7E85E|nr:uncharacterized protein C11orf97 homolog isoform X2 [Cygnus atratus]
MRAASGEQPAEEAEETGSDGRGEAARGGQPCERGGPRLASPPHLGSRFLALSPPQGKKFVYVEPSRRVKEILQEELYFQKEEYHIKHPAAVALEGIWSLKKNFSIGGLKPASQNRNGLLLQPQFYSRHAGMKK